MQFILLANVSFYNCAVALMEVSQNLKQLFIRFIYSSNQIREFIFFKILTESPQAVLHKLVDFNRIMIFMRSMYGETNWTNKPSIFAIRVNTNKCRTLPMWMTVVWLYKIFKAFWKLLDLSFNRHIKSYILISCIICKININYHRHTYTPLYSIYFIADINLSRIILLFPMYTLFKELFEFFFKKFARAETDISVRLLLVTIRV
jgi:hypothetical protein